MNFEKKQYILLDLDGTVTDSSEGIVNSVIHALSYFGIAETDRKSVERFIGPPLVDSFMEYYGFSEEQAKQAVEYYREYYKDRGIFENRVYDGVEEFLKGCRAAGKTVLLATSKPEIFARRILEHFGIAAYFDICAGSTLDGSRIQKNDVIAYAFSQLGVKDYAKASLMIGDRCYDIEGAHHFGMEAAGVLYGFGSRAEFEAAGADCIVEKLSDLWEYRA